MSKEVRVLKERMAKSLSAKNWKDALEACLQLRELEPKDERIILRLGEVHERLGQKREAVEAFREVVDLYANDGRLARAISVAKRITALDPKDESTHKKLSLLYSARGLPAAPRSIMTPGPDHPTPIDDGSTQSVEEPESETLAQVPKAASRHLADPAFASDRADVGDEEGSIRIDILDAEETEDVFAESEEERLRRKLGSAELADIDLSELDLAVVELDQAPSVEIPATPLFSDLAPEELHELMRRLVARRFSHGEEIVRQKERGDSVFVVCDGRVRVRVQRQDGDEVEVAVLEEGAFFGEFGVFTDGIRHATVVAEGSVDLLEIRMKDLVEVVRRHPRVREVLKQYYRDRAVETALAVSELFGSLEPGERAGVARIVKEETHEAGSSVIREGDEGSGLYLVRRGSLLVRTEGLLGQHMVLAELGPGDFFGEVSALTGAPATADVIASERCELLKLSRLGILQLCDNLPELRSALESAKDRRLHETIERLGEAGTI